MKTKNVLLYFSMLFVSITGLQCKSTYGPTSKKVMYKAIYIDQFKLTYVRQLLIKGYNNSKAIHEIIDADHSGFTEMILTMEDYKLIDSLTTVGNQKLQKDSAESIGRIAEGAEGKHTLGFMLNKLQSKWLDSMANKRYYNSGVKNMFKD